MPGMEGIRAMKQKNPEKAVILLMDYADAADGGRKSGRGSLMELTMPAAPEYLTGKNRRTQDRILRMKEKRGLPHLLLHMGLKPQIVLLDLGMEGGPGDP